MKNLSSKLFEKSFDLKNSKLYGGRINGQTFIECSSATQATNCSDVKTTQQDDTGKVLSSCTEYTCP